MDENKIEETLSDVQEGAADAAQAAGDAVSDAAESVTGELTETAQEVAELPADETDGAAEVLTETAEGHISESDIEIKEDIEDEIRDAYDPTVLKGTAPNSTPFEVKKGRKPLNKTNIIVIVVCAVIVVACLLFVGFKVGWFDFLKNTKGSLTLADTSRVEVYKEDVEVTDETVDYYVDSVLSSMATQETVEDGKIESGDTANIDYVGKIKETGEEFEGGSAEGYDLTIGSGSFIEGFEDGLIGAKTGDTKDLELTFPDDYQAEELQGVDVIFTVTVNSITRTKTPELTDEWVKEYSEKYCPETYNTVEEFREYCKQTVTDYYLNNAIYQYLEDNSEVKSYDTEQEQMLMDYSNDSLTYYAQMYGVDADTYATMSGHNSAEEYNRETADNYLKIAMIVDEVCKKNNITYTDEELHAAVEQYMKDQRYIDTYDVDTFIEQSGETWMWLFTNLEFKYDKAMQSLKDNVVVLEEKPTTEEDLEEDAEIDAEDIELDDEDIEIDADDIEISDEDVDIEDIDEIEADGVVDEAIEEDAAN